MIYAGPTKRTDKWSVNAGALGLEGSIATTLAHDLHRARRQPLSAFFSKAAVQNLEPLIQDKVNFMIKRIQDFQGSGQPVVMSHVFSALTSGQEHKTSFGFFKLMLLFRCCHGVCIWALRQSSWEK